MASEPVSFSILASLGCLAEVVRHGGVCDGLCEWDCGNDCEGGDFARVHVSVLTSVSASVIASVSASIVGSKSFVPQNLSVSRRRSASGILACDQTKRARANMEGPSVKAVPETVRKIGDSCQSGAKAHQEQDASGARRSTSEDHQLMRKARRGATTPFIVRGICAYDRARTTSTRTVRGMRGNALSSAEWRATWRS